MARDIETRVERRRRGAISREQILLSIISSINFSLLCRRIHSHLCAVCAWVIGSFIGFAFIAFKCIQCGCHRSTETKIAQMGSHSFRFIFNSIFTPRRNRRRLSRCVYASQVKLGARIEYVNRSVTWTTAATTIAIRSLHRFLLTRCCTSRDMRERTNITCTFYDSIFCPSLTLLFHPTRSSSNMKSR